MPSKKREVAIFEGGRCVNVLKPDEATSYFVHKQRKREFQSAMKDTLHEDKPRSRKQPNPKKKTSEDVVKLDAPSPKEKKKEQQKKSGGIPPAIILQYGRMKRSGDPGAIEFAKKHGINVRNNEAKVAAAGAAKKAPKLGKPPAQKEKRQKLQADLGYDATATEKAYRQYHQTDVGEEYASHSE